MYTECTQFDKLYTFLLIIMLVNVEPHLVAQRSGLVAKSEQQEQEIPFSFKNKPLVEIIDFLGAKMNVSIILPEGVTGQELRKQTVTYQPVNKETHSLATAWNLLYSFLDYAGFSLFKKNETLYEIVKTGKPELMGISHEPLELYINTSLADLPTSDERIRYITYLSNIKVPISADDKANPLVTIFNALTSYGGTVSYVPGSNGIIITDKASNVKSMLAIVDHIDAAAPTDTIAIIPLHYIPAADVVRILDLLKKASGEEKVSPFAQPTLPSTVSHFAVSTKIILYQPANTIILIGKQTSLERLSDFIREYLDTEAQTGNSILHVYDLQYLDSDEFAKVLRKIIGLDDQQTQVAQSGPGGPERYFSGVRIAVQKYIPVPAAKDIPWQIATQDVTLEQLNSSNIAKNVNSEIKGIEGGAIIGGNRLIIAAQQDDWIYLKDLIEKLDKPDRQVVLEVAIIDFIYDNVERLAGTSRNLTCMQLPNQGFQFLSSNISTPTNVLGTTPQQLAQDLLNATGAPGVPAIADPGSTLISFNDPATPGIWALLEILQSYFSVRVISHPFLLSTNGFKSVIESQELRRSNGDLAPALNGVPIVNVVDVTGVLRVEMVPHLASAERLRLDVAVNIEQFVGSTLTRQTRSMATTTTMQSGQVLAIGGLIREDTTVETIKTPFVGDIPIIGWLFKSTLMRSVLNNIIILINPIIIEPKKKSAPLNEYTNKHLNEARDDLANDVIFGNPRDPITHIFFAKEPKEEQAADRGVIRDYLAHASNQKEITEKLPKAPAITSSLFPPKVVIQTKELINPEKIKELLAFEDNPVLSIKQCKC